MTPTRRELFGWLLGVTRPVLAPLAMSTVCRLADQFLGVLIFALGAWSVVAFGSTGHTGASVSLGWIVGILAIACLFKAGLRYAEHFLGHLVAFKALELLRTEIFSALVPQAPRVMLTSRSGGLMARATKDVDRIEIFFAHTIAPVVSAVIVPAVVLVGISATTSWLVAVSALPFVVASLIVTPLLGSRRSLRASRKVSEARAQLVQHVTDTLQGMREVVSYGNIGPRLAETDGLGAEVAKRSRPPAYWAAARRGLNQMLLLAAAIAMVCVGLEESRNSVLDMAALAASIAAVVRLNEVVRTVEDLAASVSTSLASAERVWAVVHGPVVVPDGETSLPRAQGHGVVWEDVTYSYPEASRTALDKVSLRAEQGRWTCLAGASGSGKSTLVQLALRFDDPQSGRILIGDRDIRHLRGESLRQEVALVTQRTHLFRGSVAENLRLAAPDASDDELIAACSTACLHDEIEALPQGYDTLIGERGASLSGGQCQRLALARALLVDPAVLILDEFTSHLDPELAVRVRARLRSHIGGTTVIEVSHRLGQAMDVDQMIVLDAGRVVQTGRPEELLAVDGPLRRLMARESESV